jgi:hypothetical protein
MTSYDHLVFQKQNDVDALKDAMELELRYGKFREQKLKDICISYDGRDYMTWMQSDGANFNESIKAKVRTVLAFCSTRV